MTHFLQNMCRKSCANTKNMTHFPRNLCHLPLLLLSSPNLLSKPVYLYLYLYLYLYFYLYLSIYIYIFYLYILRV